MFCPHCGNSNNEASKFCIHCGTSLANLDSAKSSEFAGSQEDLYRAVIGPKNQNYYLSRFQKFDSEGKSRISWHWPAFFITFYWLLYRKMWGAALLYFFLPYLLAVPIGMLFAIAGKPSDAAVGLGYAVYWAIIFLLPPLCANSLYYKNCKKKIEAVKSSANDLQRQIGELSGRGGTSNVALIFVLIFVFIAIIGILAAIALPAYQDYTTRARIAEALTFGSSATEAVANYYSRHQEVPSNLEITGFNTPIPAFLKEISVNDQTGAVTITVASPPVSGKSILLVPSIDSTSHISWSCMSPDIPNKYLPPKCRTPQ